MRLIFAIALLCLAGSAQDPSCTASHYGVGDGYGGRRTASGERMDPSAMTAAHRSLPFGTRVHAAGPGGSGVVPTNARGPFVKGPCIARTGEPRALSAAAGCAASRW